MSINMGLCGCGRENRYEHSGGRSSCNKYVVCPSYKELEETVTKLRQENVRLTRDLLIGLNSEYGAELATEIKRVEEG